MGATDSIPVHSSIFSMYVPHFLSAPFLSCPSCLAFHHQEQEQQNLSVFIRHSFLFHPVLLPQLNFPVTLLFSDIPAPSSSCPPVTTWPSCHSNLSLHSWSFFFISSRHYLTFLSPYYLMTFLPLFFLSSCHISAFPVTVSSFLTVTTQLSCHLTVFFHTPIVLLSSCHKTSFLSPNSFLLLLCFLSLVSLLLPVFLFLSFPLLLVLPSFPFCR